MGLAAAKMILLSLRIGPCASAERSGQEDYFRASAEIAPDEDPYLSDSIVAG
jgi:hypothetical protein